MVQAIDSNSTTAPQAPQDAYYLPTDATPEQIFQAIGRLRKDARDAIHDLILFLDKTDDYVSRELEDGADDGPCDDRELEGSLGSFDRMTDQSKSWQQMQGEFDIDLDAEQDDADDEESDPAELSEESGIGDQDGLDEQVPFRDWQNVGMV